MTDLIDIQVRDAGTPVVVRNLTNVANAANAAAQNVNLLNQALSLSGSANPNFDKIQQAAALARGEVDKLTASMKAQASAVVNQTKVVQQSVKPQRDYSAIQRELNTNALGTTKAFSGNSKSAKELQFAMRGLPAQFTDIAVSLQGGQRPLNVLLQQGGQLKDMFGGIGPMFRALGTYILGLINPFTILAAISGVLFLAWKQGSDELVAYNKALAQTGNYAGVTAGELQGLAQQMDNLNGVTQHAAAGAIATVTASGVFVGQQIGLVSQAALQMEQLTGQAINKTIDTFKDLAKDPVSAIAELNEKQHFLTAAVYDQIKALQDQGRTQEAATLAMKTYAQAVNDRTNDVKENLGSLERAWNSLKNVAKEAWDAMLDVGRQETPDEKLGRLQQEANKAAIAYQDLKNNPPTSHWYSLNLQDKAYYASYLANAKTRSDAAIKAYHDEEHRQEDERQKVRDASTKQQANDTAIQLSQQAATYATALQKLNTAKLAAKTKADKAYAQAMQVGDAALAKQIRDNEAKVLAGLQAAYDKSLPKPKKDHSAEKAVRELDQLKKSLANVVGEISPVENAQKRLAQAQDILTKAVNTYDPALKKNLLTQQQADEIMKRLAQRYADQLDPLGALNRQLDQQNDLLKLNSEQREVEKVLLQDIQTLKEKGRTLNDTEIAQLRAKLTAQAELNRITQIQDSMLQNSAAGRAQAAGRDITATSGLLANPQSGYTKTDAFNQANSATGGLFGDSNQAIQSQLAAQQELRDRVKEYQQAGIIDEQTASQARMKIWATEQQIKLQQADSFFGNLAQLSTSSNSKIAAIGKAAAITQTIIKTYESATSAYAAMAAIPYVGPVLGAAAAAAAIAAGMANVAAIRNQQTGFRTGGSFVVGGSGGDDSQQVAFRATPGERVSINTPSQARALENGQQQKPSIKQTTINVVDPSMVGQFLTTDEGNEVFINRIQYNASIIRDSTGGG